VTALPESRLAWRPLGEILVARGLVSEIEVHDALRQQREEGGRLGEILFARGLVSAVDLRDALAEQHGLDLRVESLARHAPITSPEQQRNSFPLGRLLVQRGQITEAQLDAALAEQAVTGRRLGQILIATGVLTSFALAAALAEQQGLITAQHDLQQTARNAVSGRQRWYQVREISNGTSFELYSSRNFLDATDLAFAVLHEWEPKELHVICVADDGDELCWQYPPPAA
jgi:hypothetical protein